MDYKDLLVWQESRLLAKQIYVLSEKFPKEEIFGLTNQIRRAVVSVPSNIAEGYNRYSDKEFLHFLKISKGSTAEVETQVILAMDLSYISIKDGEEVLAQVTKVLRMLGSLIVTVKKRSENKKIVAEGDT